MRSYTPGDACRDIYVVGSSGGACAGTTLLLMSPYICSGLIANHFVADSLASGQGPIFFWMQELMRQLSMSRNVQSELGQVLGTLSESVNMLLELLNSSHRQEQVGLSIAAAVTASQAPQSFVIRKQMR